MIVIAAHLCLCKSRRARQLPASNDSIKCEIFAKIAAIIPTRLHIKLKYILYILDIFAVLYVRTVHFYVKDSNCLIGSELRHHNVQIQIGTCYECIYML